MIAEVVLGSPVTKHRMYGKTIYIKRDDLLDVHGLSGNKARKYFKLLNDTIADRDIEASKGRHSRYHLISHGGIQSNSMLALSQIAQMNPKYKFTYFTRTIPKFLKKSPIGNYQRALSYGMQVVELNDSNYEAIVSNKDVERILRQNSIDIEAVNFIKQGGISQDAELGLRTLAEEIVDFVVAQTSNEDVTCDKKGWCVFVASGTGTSAIYLNKAIQILQQATDGVKEKSPPVKIVAIPCVGSNEVLTKQMKLMNVEPHYFPEILDDGVVDKYPFAQPCEEHMEIWKRLCRESTINFDLIYAPRAWQQLQRVLSRYEGIYNIMYYHCGGHEGNDSQLRRYKRKGIL